VLLGSLSFAGLGLVGAAMVLLFRQAEGAVAWLVSLLTLVAGVIFPIRVLPGWLRWISSASPFTQTVKVARAALLEGRGWSHLWPSLAALLALTVAFVALGLVAMAAALARARKTGTLAQY
jgi:ABC-2 type transport system permease protein